MQKIDQRDGVAHASDAEWDALVRQLLPAADIRELLSDPDDRLLRLELYRYLLLSLSESYQLWVSADPDFPLWNAQFLNFPAASVGANPDTFYLSTVLEDQGIYRLWGTRGTSKLFAIQFGTPLNEVGKEGISLPLGTYSVDQLKLGPNGEFEVLVSREKPADWKGDWWPLKPHTGFAFARLVSYDWSQEHNGELHIERLNPKQPRPLRKSADEVRRQLDDVIRFAVADARRWVDYVAKTRRDGAVVNQFRINRMLDISGWDEQRYWEGFYDIAPDEALVLAIELPEKVAYWNIQLSSETWETLDFFNRISSINGAQAKMASDGKVYVVIANNDPGVPNWLDTGGFNTGHAYGRWLQASAAPLPVVHKVKLADVRKQLPADTPAVTNEQRMAEIAQRRQAAQRRFRY